LLAPKDWFIAWLAARIRFYYKQFILAVKLLSGAVEWNPDRFTPWLELGRCQQAIGLIGPAGHSFTQARQLNPACHEAGLALTALAQTGLFAQLRGWWR